jgi:transposase
MEKIRERCSGIDIGSRQVFVSLDGMKKILVYPTFTEDFKALVTILKQQQITSVAMEATGVYWVILYEMLEAAGIDVWLVDGRQRLPVDTSTA